MINKYGVICDEIKEKASVASRLINNVLEETYRELTPPEIKLIGYYLQDEVNMITVEWILRKDMELRKEEKNGKI